MSNCVILVTGNIGAGKTEACKYISEHKGEFKEITDRWTENSRDVHIIPEFIDPVALKLFYNAPENFKAIHTALFENACLNGRIARHLNAKSEKGIHIFDRGVIEGAETFGRNSFLSGYLRHRAYNEYIERLKEALDDLDRTKADIWLEKLIVYLEVEDIAVLQKRQKERGTANEIIPLEYLETINNMYKEFMENIEKVYANYGVRAPRVLRIRASVDMREDSRYHDRMLKAIIRTLKEMSV